jgi:hypothetical protein
MNFVKVKQKIKENKIITFMKVAPYLVLVERKKKYVAHQVVK